MAKKAKKSDWIVSLECKVLKEVYVKNCTEEEAKENTFKYFIDEKEIYMIDWEFKSIEENI